VQNFFILCFVDRASLYNLANKTDLVHNLFLVYFVSLYMFRASLSPSSGGTTVFMRHFVLVIPYCNLHTSQSAIQYTSYEVSHKHSCSSCSWV